MNKSKRARINQAISLIDNAMDIVDGVVTDEQDSFDNLPESFQSGDKGQIMEGAIDNLESASEFLQNAIEELELAME